MGGKPILIHMRTMNDCVEWIYEYQGYSSNRIMQDDR